jgi:hypothetical protein
MSSEIKSSLLPVATSSSEQTLYAPYTCEKYFYTFDYPCIKEHGYVEITSLNTITIYFPEKEFTDVFTNVNHNVMLFVNKQLRFSYTWLPIYTTNDIYKIRDMLNMCYLAYKHLSNTADILTYNNSFYCNEIVTKHLLPTLQIESYENTAETSIEIICNKNDSKNHVLPNNINVQFYIGKNKIFCCNELLSYASSYDRNMAIIFFLKKLIQN